MGARDAVRRADWASVGRWSPRRDRVWTGGHGARKPRGPRARARTRERRSSDPETGVAPGVTRGRNMRSRRRCSMCPAIHINSRSWLRSSSTHEPSDPPLRVVSGSRERAQRFRRSVRATNGRATRRAGARKTRRRQSGTGLLSGRPPTRGGIRPRAAEEAGGGRESGPRPPGGSSNLAQETEPAGPAPSMLSSSAGGGKARRESGPGQTGLETGTPTKDVNESSRRALRPPLRSTHRRGRGSGSPSAGRGRRGGRSRPAPPTGVRVSSIVDRFDNDPSAGSPTETLLRLLLPLDDQV